MVIAVVIMLSDGVRMCSGCSWDVLGMLMRCSGDVQGRSWSIYGVPIYIYTNTAYICGVSIRRAYICIRRIYTVDIRSMYEVYVYMKQHIVVGNPSI